MKLFGIDEIRAGDLPGYGTAYLNNLNEIKNQITDLSGIKTALRAKDFSSVEDFLRASIVLSDLTTLSLTGKNEPSTITIQETGGRTVSLPNAYLAKRKIDPRNAQIFLGVMQPQHNEEQKAFLKSCLPLIEKGRLLLRPSEILMVKTTSNFRGTQKNLWEVLNAEANSNANLWIATGESQSLGEIPVKFESDSKIPFDLTLPYLRRVSFEDLIKILEDSGDTVLNLRRAINKAIKEYSTLDQKTVAELKRDIIDPELEALERAFKKAVASHKFAIGGAVVGVLSLSLSAIFTGGTSATISGLLGAGGVGLLGKEYSAYRSKLEDMKENPFYLFWRAKRKS